MTTFVYQLIDYMSNNLLAKYPFVKIRLTPFEAKKFKEVKDQYKISVRDIFEIICSCGCQDGIITAYIQQGRVKGKGIKEVKIPRQILSNKKVCHSQSILPKE